MHASLLLSLALSALPHSKLGAYIHDASSADSAKILSACPRVALFVLPSSAAPGTIAALASTCPDTEVVVRVGLAGVKYDTSQAASQAALDYWNRINGSLAGLLPSTVSWLEGPDGLENLPDWTADAAAAAWVADFLAAFADRADAAGYRPLVGAIPSGSPKLAGEVSASSANLFEPIAKAMKAKSYRWGWSYHSFSTDLSQDAAQEAPGSLRYRRIRSECGLQGIPLVISAAGQAAPGWLSRGTSESAYLGWLRWFDARLHEDPDVQGAALFQFGGTAAALSGFALAQVCDELVSLVAAPGPDAGSAPPPDAGGQDDAGKKTTGNTIPGGSHGTPVEPDKGCSTAGVGATPCLAALVLYALWRRRL